MRDQWRSWTMPAVAVLSLALWGGPQAGAAPSRAVQTEVTLRVHVLRSTYGIQGGHSRYPAYVTVVTPPRYAHQIDAYGVGGYVLIAPTGWTGQGAIGADGSSDATLHATARAKIPGLLTFQQSSACWGCGWYDAAPYFAWVRAHWPSDLGGSPPRARRRLHEYSQRMNLVFYSAPYTADGLQVNGVAYGAMVGDADWRGSPLPGFEQEEVALPASEHAMATVVLNDFLSRYVPGK
jgi:hypothetical protein